MGNEPEVSLRRRVAGSHGPSTREIVALRLEAIRGDWIDSLLADDVIVARRSRQWLLTKRGVARYLKVVKGRYRRERTDADEEFRKQLEGTLIANLQRQLETERAAREHATPVLVNGLAKLADDGAPMLVSDRQYRAEIASQRAQILAVERICVLRGLDAPKKVEVTRADGPVAKMTPAERHERALRHARRMLAESQESRELADREPEGSA
jgi:hypothetical protein